MMQQRRRRSNKQRLSKFFYILFTVLVFVSCRYSDSNKKEMGSISKSFQTNKKEINIILSTVLEMPQLKEYYHLEKRKRIIILKNDVITKYGDADLLIKSSNYILQERVNKTDAYVEFTDINLSGNKAIVKFILPIEGVKGEAHLIRRQLLWKIQKKKLLNKALCPLSLPRSFPAKAFKYLNRHTNELFSGKAGSAVSFFGKGDHQTIVMRRIQGTNATFTFVYLLVECSVIDCGYAINYYCGKRTKSTL